MNANLFRKEWKRGRTALLLWTAILSLFTVLTMAFYPSMAENAAQIGALLESPMMKTMLEMLGGADMQSFTNNLAFYATKNIATLLLLGSIFSIIVASTIVAREENEKTADFLLTRPVTRTEVHLTKTAVWLSMVLVLNIIHTAVGFISLEVFQSEALRQAGATMYSRTNFYILSLYILLVMIAFGGMGLFVSILIRRGRPMSNVGIALVLAMYFLDALAKTVEQINFLGYISPFKYVNVSVLEPAYGLEAWRLAYLLLVPAILIGASLFFYRRKDIIV